MYLSLIPFSIPCILPDRIHFPIKKPPGTVYPQSVRKLQVIIMRKTESYIPLRCMFINADTRHLRLTGSLLQTALLIIPKNPEIVYVFCLFIFIFLPSVDMVTAPDIMVYRILLPAFFSRDTVSGDGCP